MKNHALYNNIVGFCTKISVLAYYHCTMLVTGINKKKYYSYINLINARGLLLVFAVLPKLVLSLLLSLLTTIYNTPILKGTVKQKERPPRSLEKTTTDRSN